MHRLHNRPGFSGNKMNPPNSLLIYGVETELCGFDSRLLSPRNVSLPRKAISGCHLRQAFIRQGFFYRTTLRRCASECHTRASKPKKAEIKVSYSFLSVRRAQEMTHWAQLTNSGFTIWASLRPKIIRSSMRDLHDSDMHRQASNLRFALRCLFLAKDLSSLRIFFFF